MKLIETKTLVSAAASIEFTSIPQTFTDLVALVSGRGTDTGSDGSRTAFVYLNGVTTDYTFRQLFGIGNDVPGSSGGTGSGRVRITSSDSTENTFGNGQVYIPNYTGATHKSVSIDSVTENNGVNAVQNLWTSVWANTSAITSITFTGVATNFAIGSTISLYGITKGSSGGVVVS